jgi:hypothetical protein
LQGAQTTINLRLEEAAEETAEAATAATVATAKETAIAIEMEIVTAMTPTLMPSALPLNDQQVVQKIPRHKSGSCSSLTGQNGGSINQGMNRLPYNLSGQRSHIGRMATIPTILIRVISLLPYSMGHKHHRGISTTH